MPGGGDYLARTVPGSRWTELTVPLAMLEHNQLDPDRILRRLRHAGKRLSPRVGAAAGRLQTLLRNGLQRAGGTSLLHGPQATAPLLLAAVGAIEEWSGSAPGDPPRSSRHGHYRVVRRATEFIAAHYSQDIGLPAIASHAACSPRQLQLAFKSVLGTTPLRYVKAVRLARARALLLRPGANAVSVSEAASAVGFNHRGRFSADYRRQYGELPAASIG